MLTATLAVRLLRQILQDYNYWPESESDSPLKVARSKSVIADKDILARDASMRKAITATAGYKVPERRIECKTLDQTFKPLVATSLLQLQTAAEAVKTAGAELGILEVPIEQAEFLIQVYGVFKQLANTKVCYVKDDIKAPDDAYTGLFFTGETSDGEVIVAQTLLTQT